MARRGHPRGPDAERDPFGIEVDNPAPVAAPTGDRTPRWMLAAAGAAGLALLWLVTALTGSDPSTVRTDQTEAVEEPELVSPTPRPTPTPTPVPDPTPTPEPTPLNFFEAREADTARAQLATAAAGFSIVYLSEDGVGQLRLDTGEAPPLRAEVTNLWRFAGGQLLRSTDGRVYAIDGNDLELVHIVATDHLAAVGGPSTVVFATDAGSTNVSIVEVVDDVPTWTRVSSPIGTELRPVDGLGMIAFHPDEGSWLATLDGFELLTEGEIVAASSAAWLERSCADTCVLDLVSRLDGTRHRLPDSFVDPDDSWSVAPDGDNVLRVTLAGYAELYTASLPGVSFVTGEGMVAPAWAPDSSFIAWIDLVQPDPRLKVMRPDRRDWVVVDLGVLGASAPSDPQLLVIPQPAP
ncbi:MAG: hypothetical protein AAF480_12095 [Actinomycetota bacterium]